MASSSIAVLEAKLDPLIKNLERRADVADALIKDLSKGDTEAAAQIAELKRELAVIKQQLSGLDQWKNEQGSFIEVRTTMAVLKSDLEEAKKADMKSAVAILRNDVEDLKKHRDQWSNRVWGVVQLGIGATIGAILTYLLKK